MNFFLVVWLAKDSNPGLLDCEIPKREDQILDGKGSWGVQWRADVTERGGHLIRCLTSYLPLSSPELVCRHASLAFLWLRNLVKWQHGII